jgi:hypothetical protein
VGAVTRAADWAEMAAAVMAYIDAYGGSGAFDALNVIDGYTAITTQAPERDRPERRDEPCDCDDDDEPFELIEPGK